MVVSKCCCDYSWEPTRLLLLRLPEMWSKLPASSSPVAEESSLAVEARHASMEQRQQQLLEEDTCDI